MAPQRVLIGKRQRLLLAGALAAVLSTAAIGEGSGEPELASPMFDLPPAVREFETHISQQLRTPRALGVRIAIVPLRRDALLQAPVDGHIDIAVANLTVARERARQEMMGAWQPTPADLGVRAT